MKCLILILFEKNKEDIFLNKCFQGLNRQIFSKLPYIEKYLKNFNY